jgi:hypothetical protein
MWDGLLGLPQLVGALTRAVGCGQLLDCPWLKVMRAKAGMAVLWWAQFPCLKGLYNLPIKEVAR